MVIYSSYWLHGVCRLCIKHITGSCCWRPIFRFLLRFRWPLVLPATFTAPRPRLTGGGWRNSACGWPLDTLAVFELTVLTGGGWRNGACGWPFDTLAMLELTVLTGGPTGRLGGWVDGGRGGCCCVRALSTLCVRTGLPQFLRLAAPIPVPPLNSIHSSCSTTMSSFSIMLLIEISPNWSAIMLFDNDSFTTVLSVESRISLPGVEPSAPDTSSGCCQHCSGYRAQGCCEWDTVHAEPAVAWLVVSCEPLGMTWLNIWIHPGSRYPSVTKFLYFAGFHND